MHFKTILGYNTGHAYEYHGRKSCALRRIVEMSTVAVFSVPRIVSRTKTWYGRAPIRILDDALLLQTLHILII